MLNCSKQSNLNCLRMQIGGMEIQCRNLEETNEIYQEIFINEVYRFEADSLNPRILDCGSHIGLSVLYFKKQYPGARIVAFEPDPVNFKLLEENIKANEVHDVEIHNTAITDKDGYVKLYGEFSSDCPRTSGNSTMQNWANPNSSVIEVESSLLSRFLVQEVDFLKLDIEGAECGVIEEIADKLHFIKTLCVEFHGINNDQDHNLQKIQSILEKQGFTFHVEYKLLENIFPSHLLQWAKDSGLVLAVITASRKQ